MARAHGFEDLKVWQLARELVLAAYQLTSSQVFGRDHALRDQIRRAAVSSMANIAEGFERGSNRDFVRFLYMARGSAGEVRSRLYVARDLDYITGTEFERMASRVIGFRKAYFGLSSISNHLRRMRSSQNPGRLSAWFPVSHA